MCGIVGLLLKKPDVGCTAGRTAGAHAGRHDRSRPGLRGTRRVRVAGLAAHQAQPVPVCMAAVDWSAVHADVAGSGLPGEHCAARQRRHAVLSSRAGRRGRQRALSKEHCPGLVGAVAGPSHRSLQGHRHPGRTSPQRYGFVELHRQSRRGPHAHGHRIRRDAGACASLHRRRGFLPGAQRLAVESLPACAASSNRSASTSKPTTTPKPPAGSSSGACARATASSSAIDKGFTELDGFFTFLIGTDNGLSLVRDPFACKPAIVAETDDYVAIASEFRSLAHLPGVGKAQSCSNRSRAPSTHGSAHERRDGIRSRAGGRRCAHSTAGCIANAPTAPLPKVQVLNPDGAHAIAGGVDAPFEIDDRWATPATTSRA